MRISFEPPFNDVVFHIELVIDSMFMADIVLNFNTGFYKGGKLEMSRIAIAKDYICPWLFIDVISSCPYTWILAGIEGVSIRDIEADDRSKIGSEDEKISGAVANAPQLLRLLKIAKMLKMLKLLRVMKLKKLMNKFEEYVVTDSIHLVLTFFSLTIQLLVVCHYIGCFFFYFGMEEYRADPEYNGWLIGRDMLEKDFTGKYITSVYWALTTMAAIGYGDIYPITMQERIYGLLIILASSSIFAYMINRISSTV